jgi:hypothetical protein
MILQVAESKGYKHPKTSIKTHRNKKKLPENTQTSKILLLWKSCCFFQRFRSSTTATTGCWKTVKSCGGAARYGPKDQPGGAMIRLLHRQVQKLWKELVSKVVNK